MSSRCVAYVLLIFKRRYVGAVIRSGISKASSRVSLTIRFTAKDKAGNVLGINDFPYVTVPLVPLLEDMKKVEFGKYFRGVWAVEMEVLGRGLVGLVLDTLAVVGVDDVKVNLFS